MYSHNIVIKSVILLLMFIPVYTKLVLIPIALLKYLQRGSHFWVLKQKSVFSWKETNWKCSFFQSPNWDWFSSMYPFDLLLCGWNHMSNYKNHFQFRLECLKGYLKSKTSQSSILDKIQHIVIQTQRIQESVHFEEPPRI